MASVAATAAHSRPAGRSRARAISGQSRSTSYCCGPAALRRTCKPLHARSVVQRRQSVHYTNTSRVAPSVGLRRVTVECSKETRLVTPTEAKRLAGIEAQKLKEEEQLDERMKAEILNGRFSMLGFAIGLYVEYTTGEDFPHQIMAYFKALVDLLPTDLPSAPIPELPSLPDIPDFPDAFPRLPEMPSFPLSSPVD
eukprot:scaffold1237_cov403-Prasinococcus_capsulatus_cf.AAC.2